MEDFCIGLPQLLKIQSQSDTIMKIESDKGYYYPCEKCRIEVYRIDHLAQLDGYIDGSKVIEIEPLNNQYVAVKLFKNEVKYI